MRTEIKWCSALVLAAACALGCNGTMEGGATGGGNGGHGGDGDFHGTDGVYSVPVVEAHLEPWSTYPVPFFEVERVGTSIKIEYDFPTHLAGTLVQVELIGTYEEGATSFPVIAGEFGELGSGDCTVTGTRFECTEHLPGIVVDRAQAEWYMQNAGVPAAEIGKRLSVTDAFSVDPIGIFAFDMP